MIDASRTAAAGPTFGSPDALALEAALEAGREIGFKNGKRGIDHLWTRDDDDIESGWFDLPAEDLSHQAFRAVAPDGAAELPGGGHAEAGRSQAVGQDEEGQEPTLDPRAPLVHPLELRPPTDALLRTERGRTVAHDPARAVSSYGQTLAPFGPPALQHQTTVLRPHPDEEAMRPLAAACVRLKRAFHD